MRGQHYTLIVGSAGYHHDLIPVRASCFGVSGLFPDGAPIVSVVLTQSFSHARTKSGFRILLVHPEGLLTDDVCWSPTSVLHTTTSGSGIVCI